MSCLTCHHFVELTEDCTLANPPRKPPARVIAYGCASHFNPNEAILEHNMRGMDFNAKPRPAPPSVPASVMSYNIAKPKAATNLKDWEDDIPF